MAEFYKGFTYEFDVTSKLTIEGRIIDDVPVPDSTEDRRALARRIINDFPALANRKKQTEIQKGYLRQGKTYWNTWRQDYPEIHPMLADADLHEWPLEGFDLSYANMTQACLKGANLRGVNFHQAILAKANLENADLTGANFCRTDLYETIFTDACLVDANLQGVQLVRNDFTGAEVVNCNVYGLSAWDVEMDSANKQEGFVIRYRPGKDEEEQKMTVNGLEMAGFTYLALHNKNLTRLFNDVGKKWVLLLGRFSERKKFLEELAERLKQAKQAFIPIIFDFPGPDQRDLIETVLLLAGMSAFVIVDLTDPKSTPLELQTIVPNYAVPIVPIILKGQDPFSMFTALRKFDWVLAPLTYDNNDNLFKGLQRAVIEPAIAKAQSLIDWKAQRLQTRDIHDYL
jgi:hypothetical protein